MAMAPIWVSFLLGLWSQAFVAVSGTCSSNNFELPSGIVLPPQFSAMPEVGIYVLLAGSITPGVTKSETPLAIRAFSYIDGTAWNCVAAYDTTKLDVFRLERPVVTVPETVSCQGNTLLVHTTEARTQCMIHVYAAIIPMISPNAIKGFQGAMTELGAFGMTPFEVGIHADVQACATETDRAAFKTCLEAVAVDHDFSPRIMGSILAQDSLLYALDDGWNMDGTNEGACEYNCRPYADTTGYEPRNKGVGDSFKNNWQPLLEDDGRGFFYRQEHVTPHIGKKATPRILTRQELEARSLPDPNYDYRDIEAPLVLDRLANLDDQKKMEIEFFDNKANVVALISRGLLFRYLTDFTLERILLFSAVYTAAELDAVILAWKEKVIHDKVRTTTVIQQARYRTPREITTYAGPYQGVQTFDAKDFQPYIRIMPHAEYPSGSGCICAVNRDMTYAFMNAIFQDDGAGFVTSVDYVAGSSLIEPNMTPDQDFSISYTLESIRDTCGKSRLDGGMHFTNSVPDSYELCSDFGPLVENFILDVLDGSTDLITTYNTPSPPGPP